MGILQEPTREEILELNMLSMLRVETHNFKYDLPFYPFPFRTEYGAIMFPANVKGVYMRDEVMEDLNGSMSSTARAVCVTGGSIPKDPRSG